MTRLDRALGILLLLRDGQTHPAAELARRFEVSSRTIYRDVDSLAALGVPIYAEAGRGGGFRLMDGYFLPPLMLSVGEAISLLLGLTLLVQLRAKPFAAELETAERKLLAAVPERLRTVLSRAAAVIGFEQWPGDAFHPERTGPEPAGDEAQHEGAIVEGFLQAVLAGQPVSLDYHTPYGSGPTEALAAPQGVLWDRDHWYLLGAEPKRSTRLWRADRVRALRPQAGPAAPQADFDVRDWLGRRWLQPAMKRWARESPVRVRLSRGQAERLQTDWYYRHAEYQELADGQIVMALGEDDPQIVFDLLRWLGPGAELIEPAAWRARLRDELDQMRAAYSSEVSPADY